MMGPGFGYGYNMMDGGSWVGGLLLFLFGLVIIAGIVLLIVWAVRQSTGRAAAGGSGPPAGAVGHDEAVAIAKRRLASGEITKEQYEEVMRVLGG